ncbi:DUF6404 family protein [Marinomonas mediterranea]|uniref:DUF6404 family protein n=1 Tax=Marinomonas mediterranea TaxID=119864 RepID=UPI00234B0876|nr:DUF6404 family protein [Marinomonas mediterranea]WCN09178.1 hypothetical protein GV055_09705 [Marinomonas mediterranea]WCN13261.1 hypothetical protein GV054_09715 [Marinomonas mediterranea]
MFFSRFTSPIHRLISYFGLDFIFVGKLGFTLSTFFLGIQFAVIWGGLMWLFYWSVNPIELSCQFMLSIAVGLLVGGWMTYTNSKYPDSNHHYF